MKVVWHTEFYGGPAWLDWFFVSLIYDYEFYIVPLLFWVVQFWFSDNVAEDRRNGAASLAGTGCAGISFSFGAFIVFFVSFTDFVGGAGHHRSAAVGPPAVSRRPGCVGSRQMTLARHGWINHTTRRWFSVSCCCFLFWVSTGSPCVASAVRHSIEFYRVSPTVPHRPRISLFESRMRRGAGPNWMQ